MSFSPPEGEQNATAALELCSLGTMHVRLGLPPGWVIRNWRDWDQGFVRGSKRVLGSCKQEKRSARLQRVESGCPKEEGGKRPSRGKKKKKHRNLQRPSGKEAEEKLKERDSVEAAQTLRPRKTQRNPVDPVQVLQHIEKTGEVWDLANKPRALGCPGELFPRENAPFTCSGSFL